MKIVNKQVLLDKPPARIIQIEVNAPEIAAKARAGEFVVVMVSENGERVPLTIADTNLIKGTITLIFQEAGYTTGLLGALECGAELYALVGPLGHATEIRKYGKIILVGGGVGIGEIYPVAKAFKKALNHVTTVLGARSKDFLILENELRAHSDEFIVTTDDGSYGRKGFTTDAVGDLLKAGPYDLVYAVGPIPMMRRVAAVTKEFGVKTMVSLNPLMVDGTGMCGGCRVSVAGKAQFTCVDGPEFDGHAVEWDELIKRNAVYSEKEKHLCKLGRDVR